MQKTKLQKTVGNLLDTATKTVHEWNGHPEIFSLPQVIENCRQFLLLRTDIVQKTVVGCTCLSSKIFFQAQPGTTCLPSQEGRRFFASKQETLLLLSEFECPRTIFLNNNNYNTFFKKKKIALDMVPSTLDMEPSTLDRRLSQSGAHFTRIEPQGASCEKRSRHIYFACRSILSLKFFVYSKQHSAHNERIDQRMREVIACKRLKTMENHQLSGPKSGHGRLREVVVY